MQQGRRGRRMQFEQPYAPSLASSRVHSFHQRLHNQLPLSRITDLPERMVSEEIQQSEPATVFGRVITPNRKEDALKDDHKNVIGKKYEK